MYLSRDTESSKHSESEGCGNSCAAICLWSMPAMGGIFSEKSHEYSFGVLLLKIIGGRKNTSFSYIYFPKLSLSSTTV